MSPEEKDLLEKILDLAKDNNKMLHKLNRAKIIGAIWHVFYWLIVIGISLGAYYLAQPYVDAIREVLPDFGTSTVGTGDVIKNQ